MAKRKYVIERLVQPVEYVPVSLLMKNYSPMWKETVWPEDTNLAKLKKRYGYEYRKVKHGR
jgi:hypothetical protein